MFFHTKRLIKNLLTHQLVTIPGFDSTVLFHGSEAINLLSVGEFVGFFGLKFISSFLHLILCPFKLTLEIAIPANLNRAKCDQTLVRGDFEGVVHHCRPLNDKT